MGRMSNDHDPPAGLSTRLVSFSADSADPPGINDYDSFAEAYAASNENNLVNAYYERPAMLALAGDVAGRRILDAGCGSGPLLAALRDLGAIVTGIDKSAGMLELARRRLGDDADLQVAELGSPLPFPDDTFADVTASHRAFKGRLTWAKGSSAEYYPEQCPGQSAGTAALSSCSIVERVAVVYRAQPGSPSVTKRCHSSRGSSPGAPARTGGANHPRRCGGAVGGGARVRSG